MIKLLDCTLRDGGYINNWEFGEASIVDMIQKLESTNVDILEFGFLKNEPYNRNRAVFNDMKQISALIPNKNPGIEYAVMIEVVNPIPLEMLAERSEDSVDIIRVIVWKTKYNEKGVVIDALQEGFEYCKGIVDRGYKLCVQPARVDQYSDDEFVEMVRMFQTLNPLAIYVVDSWGTQNAEQVMHFVELADRNLMSGISIGYHGHNNLMQTFGTAIEFANAKINRDIIIDASVYGIGRGAGNLNLELFAKFLNDCRGKDYILTPMIDIYEKYIKDIFAKHEWGYSIPYYLTAQYNCNPNYGEYLGMEKGVSPSVIDKVLASLTEEDKVLYSKKKAELYLEKVLRDNIMEEEQNARNIKNT